LAADAMACGDINWSNVLSSIQTDEGTPRPAGLPDPGCAHGARPARAQRAIDVAFWRSTRLFQTLTGRRWTTTPVDNERCRSRKFDARVGRQPPRADPGRLRPAQTVVWEQFPALARERGTTRCTWAPGSVGRPSSGSRPRVSPGRSGSGLVEEIPTWEEKLGRPVGRDHRERAGRQDDKTWPRRCPHCAT
jgi:hypothetical protein